MRSFLISIGAFCAMQVCQAQSVVQAEYFLDTDLGFGKNSLVTVNAAADGSFLLNIAMAKAAAGFHQLYIRTKDASGKWSLTTRKTIEVISPAAKSITNGEYYFDDNEQGFGNATPFGISPNDSAISQNFTAAVSKLLPGDHKLYIRVKDIDGKWGQTSRLNIEVINAPLSVLAGGEYFFITDPGVGDAVPFHFSSTGADSSFSFNVPLQNIPSGADRIYIRVRDSVNQHWSHTQWQTDSVVTSVQSGLWSDVNTWSNHKIPVSSTVVILHHDVIVDINGICKSLTPYRNDVHVTVNQGMKLNVTGH